MNEKATILNGINIKNHPSIVFMTGLFTDDGAQVEWGPTEDISYSGGTIDMNGALNEEGTKAKKSTTYKFLQVHLLLGIQIT